MGRFIIKKCKFDGCNESSVAGTSSGSNTHSTVSVLKMSCANITETISPSDSFHQENSSHGVCCL
jgi:hypothetical protein